MGVTYDLSHAGQNRELFRSALGIASGDHDLAAGVFPMDPANRCARILVGGSSHSARIKDGNSGLRRRGPSFQSQFPKLALDRCSVGLRSPATKVLYIEACHVHNTN